MRVLLALLLVLSGDEFAAGVAAYQEGRFRAALEAFAAAEARAGNDASAALLYNRALAALRAGQLRVAEFSAEKAAVRGGPELAPRRDFLLGSAAFARCLRAEAEANLREADPTALAQAIEYAETARDSWRRAAVSRADWPEARRNVERALIALERLRRKKEEAEKEQAKKAKDPKREPQNPDEREESEQDPRLQQGPARLSRAELALLLRKLDEKEKEKRALRRARQRLEGGKVEKDW